MTILIVEISNLIEETGKLKHHVYSPIEQLKRRLKLAKEIYKKRGVMRSADYVLRQLGSTAHKMGVQKGVFSKTIDEINPKLKDVADINDTLLRRNKSLDIKKEYPKKSADLDNQAKEIKKQQSELSSIADRAERDRRTAELRQNKREVERKIQSETTLKNNADAELKTNTSYSPGNTRNLKNPSQRHKRILGAGTITSGTLLGLGGTKLLLSKDDQK
jgi:hypothetical protein